MYCKQLTNRLPPLWHINRAQPSQITWHKSEFSWQLRRHCNQKPQSTHTYTCRDTHTATYTSHTPTLPYSIKKSMSKYAKFTKQGHVGLGGLEWQVQVHENGIDAWLAWHMQLLAQPSQAQFQTESPTPTHCSAVGTNWFPAVRAEIVWHSSVQLTSHVWAQDGGRRNVLQFKGDGTKLWSALFASGGNGEWGLWTKNSCWLVWRPQCGFKLSHNSILTTLRIRNTVGDQ